MFLDLIYHANDANPTIRETIQIMDMVLYLGWYKLDDGSDEYRCTTKMIDQLTEHLKSMISDLDTDEKIDLAMALS